MSDDDGTVLISLYIDGVRQENHRVLLHRRGGDAIKRQARRLALLEVQAVFAETRGWPHGEVTAHVEWWLRDELEKK